MEAALESPKKDGNGIYSSGEESLDYPMKDSDVSHSSSEESGEGSVNQEQQEQMERLSLGSDHGKGSPMNSDYEGDDFDSEIEREGLEMTKYRPSGSHIRCGNFSDDDELMSREIEEDGTELYRIRLVEDNDSDKAFLLLMELLKEIGCESGFMRRSKFVDGVFYAKLKNDEADWLNGNGIFYLFPASELMYPL